jgi:hypothetical protein
MRASANALLTARVREALAANRTDRGYAGVLRYAGDRGYPGDRRYAGDSLRASMICR